MGSLVKAQARKIGIGIAGSLVLLVGVALLVLPGPAFLVIPAGLAILATEFEWAERLKNRAQERFRRWRTERETKRGRSSESSA